MNIPAIEVCDEWFDSIKERNIERMTNLARKNLSTKHYRLSAEAKKRLRWLYILYYEKDGNITKASNNIGISRQ